MQAVGELDQDDADVVRHRHEHLLEVLRLRLGVRLELDLGQLRQAVDDLRDLGTEFRADLVLADQGVLDDVVQHGRDERLVVHVHLGEDAGDFQRMLHVRRSARLALVRLGAEAVGVTDWRTGRR